MGHHTAVLVAVHTEVDIQLELVDFEVDRMEEPVFGYNCLEYMGQEGHMD